MDWKLIDMISNPAFVRKIKHANYKGYVNKKLNKVMDSGNKYLPEAVVLDSFKSKKLKNIKTEEPLKGYEAIDLSDMSSLESDEV